MGNVLMCTHKFSLFMLRSTFNTHSRESPYLCFFFSAHHILLMLNNLSTVCKFEFRVCCVFHSLLLIVHNYIIIKFVYVHMAWSLNKLRISMLSFSLSVFFVSLFCLIYKKSQEKIGVEIVYLNYKPRARKYAQQ